MNKDIVHETELSHEVDKTKQDQDNLQYNSQDLDQEQNVDVKPFQYNTQSFHVHEENKDYSSKIKGITYGKACHEILPYVTIEIFFGHLYSCPVGKTKSDCNGKFCFDDLPPGYYSIRAYDKNNMNYQQRCIKVLPCQKVHLPLLLEKYRTKQHTRDETESYNKYDQKHKPKYHDDGIWN